MTELQPSVLAAIDGSRSAESVCDYASWIARVIGAELKLLHTISTTLTPVSSDLSGSIGLGAQDELLNELTNLERQRSKLLLEKGRLMLEASKDRAQRSGAANVTVMQRHGDLVESLIELEEDTRVLVMGIRGESHDGAESGLGNKLESVLRSLHRPMLVVNSAFVEPKTILLAYDGGDSATKALNMVASSPLFKSVHCHVVYAGKEASGAALLKKSEEVLSDAEVECTTHCIEGDLGKQIADLQSKYDVDMTVMGAYSHGKLRDFLVGSLTTEVLKNTAKPLLFLR
ncbi:MAG: universal stress protein [Gammaproteobacteria bacterium]|nr:universal stress protein [Gammaproteobacteria bacterium]